MAWSGDLGSERGILTGSGDSDAGLGYPIDAVPSAADDAPEDRQLTRAILDEWMRRR